MSEMTVRELIERLQQADPDALVVLSHSPTGSADYSPALSMRANQVYVAATNATTGKIYPITLDVYDRMAGRTDDDTFDAQHLEQDESARPAVVLWPLG